MSKISASVRAVVTIEIHVGTWESASTFDELDKICKREATQAIRNQLSGVTIIGDPVIKVSTFQRD